MNLKQLAAAAAIACAAPAFAGINTLNGDAELFAIVWDETAATYAIDFGITVDQLAASTGSFTLGSVGGANWASYVAADENLGDHQPFEGTRWAIVAFDDDDQFTFERGDLNFYSTTQGGMAPAIVNEGLEVMLNIGIGAAGIFAQNGMTPNPAANLDLFAAVGEAAHFVEIPSQPLRLGNAIGTSTGFFGCTYDDFRAGTSKAYCTAFTNAAGQAVSVGFDGSSFSVTAVPEPGTYAMLLAGLAAVGVVARRRA
jgi:hypothetical protein